MLQRSFWLLPLLLAMLAAHKEIGANAKELEMDGIVMEDHEEVKPKDLTAAIFLLGGVTFVMSLFYLVNHPDMDIRDHTWKVINATVSIFVSVLLFQGITGVSDRVSDTYLTGQSHQSLAKICFAYFTFLVFYCALHGVLFNLAYSTDEERPKLERKTTSFWGLLPARSTILVASEDGTFETKRKRKIACWATLLSHMAGFAHIRCSLDLQQLEVFKGGAMAIVPTIINALLLVVIFKLSDSFRRRFEQKPASKGFHLWEMGAEEAEDDIAAIGISFSSVVVLRYAFTKQMANVLGLELPVVDHAMYAKIAIGCATLIFALISILILVCLTKFRSPKKGQGYERAQEGQEAEGRFAIVEDSQRRDYLTRWILIASSTFATAASWCGLYASKWFLYGIEIKEDEHTNPNSCISRVVLALLVSFGSFVMIYFLDKLSDLESTDDDADHAIEEVIHAIGVSVGFAWEQAFDAGVETIGERTESLGKWYPVWARLGFALMISAVMIPAWRLYLIKRSLEKHVQCKKKNKEGAHGGDNKCEAVLVIDAKHCHMCGLKIEDDGGRSP